MVGPASLRVTDSEGLHLSDRSGEKHRLQAHAKGNAQSNLHSRQPNMKNYPGGECGRQNGQRMNKGADCKAEGAPVVNGRNYPPSFTSSSGRSEHAPSNEDRFLEVTTPCVKTQNLGKSRVRDASQKRCFNPEEATFFSLGDLWDSFDEWSAYGAGVPLVLNGGESVVQYYVPYLSAIELHTSSSRQSDFSTGSRNLGSESDANSEASSDGESDRCFPSYKGSENLSDKIGPSGSSSKVQCRPLKHGDDDMTVMYSFFETISPYSRVPLVDKITELSRIFPKLRTLESHELLPSSFLSVAWYPIYRIPTGPTLRDLDACFLTFHPLSKPLQSGDATLMSPPRHKRVMPKKAPLGTQALDVFALASYKLRGAVWSTDSETRQDLQLAAYEHLSNAVKHGDLNYFSSHSTPNRR